MMKHLTGAGLALLALMITAPTPRGADLSAQAFAQALQKKYDTIRDFSADFEHVYTGGVLRKRLSERGRMQIKKPGKMRWEYTAPEKKTFVSDGVKFYSYIPADRQVIVSSVPSADTTTPALFLAGQGNLTRDFTVSDTATSKEMPTGTRALRLEPRSPQSEFEALVLSVDGTALTLRGLESVDAQGGTSSFLFTNLKENVGLTDKDFTFTMPRGVDVVSDDPAAAAAGRHGGTSAR